MNNDAIFRDNTGVGWHINITYGDILRVKQHVTTADGKPLDLCYIAETGDFTSVTEHIDVLVQCVYWLIYPLVTEYSGKSGIDAQEWFYSRIDGKCLPSLVTTFKEALVNFTPTHTVKTAMMTAMGQMERAEIVTAIQELAGLLETCTDSQVSSESIPKDTATGN